MKKILSLVAVFAVLGLSGCGGSTSTQAVKPKKISTPTAPVNNNPPH